MRHWSATTKACLKVGKQGWKNHATKEAGAKPPIWKICVNLREVTVTETMNNTMHLIMKPDYNGAAVKEAYAIEYECTAIGQKQSI